MQHKNGYTSTSPNMNGKICVDEQGGVDAIENKYF